MEMSSEAVWISAWLWHSRTTGPRRAIWTCPGLFQQVERPTMEIVLRALGKNARESAARSKDERESAGNRAARPCFALRTRGHCSFFPNALRVRFEIRKRDTHDLPIRNTFAVAVRFLVLAGPAGERSAARPNRRRPGNPPRCEDQRGWPIAPGILPQAHADPRQPGTNPGADPRAGRRLLPGSRAS